MMAFTDEMLMAYADGALDAETTAALERALAGDAALASRVAQMAGARAALKQAFDPAPPVPAELEARIRAMSAPSNVVSLAERRRVVPFWQVPLAAGLALAIGAGSVYLAAGRGAEGPGALQLAKLEDPGILRALDSLPSGSEVDLGDGARLVTITSFLDETDQLCREFEHDRAGAAVVAVACHAEGAWEVRFAVASASSAAEDYAPAGSLEALDAYLAASGAGAPLAAEDEAAALAALR